MGSRVSGPPPIPRSHLWELKSEISVREAPLAIQFETLLAQIRTAAAKIKLLIDQEEVEGSISVVRVFTLGEAPADGEQSCDESRYERLDGQHPSFGFQIPPSLLRFVANVGIGFDVDEYLEDE